MKQPKLNPSISTGLKCNTKEEDSKCFVKNAYIMNL